MGEIATMAERIVKKAKEYDRDTIPGDYATLETPCPNCGGIVKENYRRFACTGMPASGEGCGFSISKIPGGRSFELDEVEALPARQEDRPARGLPLEGRLAVHGRAQAGLRRRDRQLEARVRLRRGREAAKASRASRSTSPTRRASAPARSARATSTSTAPATSASTRSARTSTCDFKSGKIILQQPVAREQMTQAAGHRQDRPARELRLQQDAAQVQGVPGLRREGRQGRASSSSRVRPGRASPAPSRPRRRRRQRRKPRPARRQGHCGGRLDGAARGRSGRGASGGEGAGAQGGGQEGRGAQEPAQADLAAGAGRAPAPQRRAVAWKTPRRPRARTAGEVRGAPRSRRNSPLVRRRVAARRIR